MGPSSPVHMAARRWPLNLVPHVARAPLAGGQRPPRALGPLLACAFFALYALTAAGTLSSRDGGVMYDTALAILNRHTLTLPPHHHGLPGVHGGFYSKYGIAQSVAEIPILVVGQALASLAHPPLSGVLALAVTMLVNPLITALAVWLIFWLAFELWPETRAAVLTAALIGVASPLWPYAKTDFSEPLSTLALAGAALFLVRARGRAGVLNLLLSGAFTALALLAKLTAGFVLPALAFYALFVIVVGAGGRLVALARGLLAWAVPVAAGLGLVALYNVARFGRPTDTGYHAEDVPFHFPLLRGLEGLLVGPGKGLLWYCPLVLLALALWPTLLARRRAEALLALGLIVPTLIVFATYPVWWGGVCWGPRYLVPVVPFVLLPLVYVLDRWPRAVVARRSIVLLIALSVGVQVLGVAVHPERFLATGISDADYLWRTSDSPLLGNAWLLAYDAVRSVDQKDAAAMLSGYPWRHAAGVSATQRLAISHWDYWWWQVLRHYGASRRALAVPALAALVLLALAAWRLWVALRRYRANPFDHRRMAVRGERGYSRR